MSFSVSLSPLFFLLVRLSLSLVHNTFLCVRFSITADVARSNAMIAVSISTLMVVDVQCYACVCVFVGSSRMRRRVYR